DQRLRAQLPPGGGGRRPRRPARMEGPRPAPQGRRARRLRAVRRRDRDPGTRRSQLARARAALGRGAGAPRRGAGRRSGVRHAAQGQSRARRGARALHLCVPRLADDGLRPRPAQRRAPPAQGRPGAELGQEWYEDGRLLHKKNTFNDFVDVTDFLVANGYAARGKMFAEGASAGGLLMGAIANQAGSRYRAISLRVPFVDAVTTMLDETIPLTANEWTQWGDPRVKGVYEYILSY